VGGLAADPEGAAVRFLSPLWLLALLPAAGLVAWSVLAARRGTLGLSVRRRPLFLAFRAAAAVLMVAGLAGMALTLLTDRLSVIFVLDQSRSVTGKDREEALGVIEAIRRGLSRGDQAALVRFGADAELERLDGAAAPDPEAGAVNGEATDLGGALQFALAQAGPGAAPRIVLLSDGNETRGSAVAAAAVARSLGARIFTVPLGSARAPVAGSAGAAGPAEVSVEDVRSPDSVRAGEAQVVTVLLRSRTALQARISLFRDSEPVASQSVALSAGENAVTFSGSFPGRGLHAWDALVQAAGDTIPQNNHARRYVEVTGAPQVLYVAGPGRESPSFLAALAAQGVSVARTSVAALPSTLAGYLPYDALILDNAPGFGISTEKMETIRRYVRDTGGGLLMVGGENSFGAGGYYKTPIEEALPVDMDVKSQVQLPRLSLVLMVDKSGSMAGTVATGETKLDVVKSAALSAIESLNKFDTVGLLAFDADWEWTVPLTSAGETTAIAVQLADLVPGGGTIMYPALEETDRVLSRSLSPLRHVIILTDGLTNAGDFGPLVDRMAKERITVSTVSIGEDADSALLKDLARRGGGRSYATNDPRDVPRIFMTETTLVSRGLLVEKSFFPRAVSAGEMLRGVDLSALPALKGFVLSYTKQGAETILSALYDAPLLASWRYGLGRSAAFTSDLRGTWAGGLLAWGPFPRFAGQLVRWLERPTAAAVLHPRIEASGGRATVSVDAYDAVGTFVDGLAVKGVVTGPSGAPSDIALAQTGPGQYEGSFDTGTEGDWLVSLSAGSETAPVTVGLSIPYSDEYRLQGVNTGLLSAVAAATGGRVVAGPDDAEGIRSVLHRESSASAAGETPWRWLLLAALLFFVLDILVRRLVLPEGLRGRLAGLLRGLRPAATPGYEDLAVMVKKAREEERAKLRQRIVGQGRDGSVDADLAAYLYIARLHSRRAERDEGGK
jgi:Ca-activated chloride channel homolog